MDVNIVRMVDCRSNHACSNEAHGEHCFPYARDPSASTPQASCCNAQVRQGLIVRRQMTYQFLLKNRHVIQECKWAAGRPHQPGLPG